MTDDVPTTEQADRTPAEDRTIYAMMIRIEKYALIAGIDLDTGMGLAFTSDGDTPHWEKVSMADMMNDEWLTLTFNEPMKFVKAMELAEEYRTKTLIIQKHMNEYQAFIREIQNKTKKV